MEEDKNLIFFFSGIEKDLNNLISYSTNCSVIKSYDLPGILPPDIVKLPYLQYM